MGGFGGQACGHESGVFRYADQRIGPGKREPGAYNWGNPVQHQRLQAGKEVAKCVGTGRTAEVDAESQDEMDKAGARLTQFEYGGPQDVGEHDADEVKVLSKGDDELICQVCAMLMNDEVGEQRGSNEQRRGRTPNIAAGLHLREDLLVELDDHKEHQDRQQAVGVVVDKMVLPRGHAVSGKGDIAGALHRDGAEHIEVQGNIAEKIPAVERAQNDAHFQNETEYPDGVVERTKHASTSPERLVPRPYPHRNAWSTTEPDAA